MNLLIVFFENFRAATAGLNVLAKIIIAIILFFIFFAVIFAITGVVRALFE